MNKQDFATLLENIKDLTVIQIFKVIPRLRYKTVVALLAFFAALVGSSFVAGRYSHQKETAVMLESPFAMRIAINDQQYDFTSLTLTRDPVMSAPSADMVVLSLREIKSAFDILPVGKIVAQVEKNNLTGIWSVIVRKVDIVPNAYAVPERTSRFAFNWNGHQNDMKFKEKFEDEDTVYRYYSDGCILAYEVDSSRRSIPETFRWIKTTH